MVRLHITNGDSAAGLLNATGIGGDVLAWRDPMHYGPFPAGLDLDAVSKVRARYLAGPEFDVAEAVRDFRLRDAHLKAAGRYDEVVLWFEHDLLDQLQIVQLLDWFHDADLPSTRLMMICIDRFPGVSVFRGLGQLNVEQVASLFGQRVPVTRAQMALAVVVWRAFRASNPNALVTLLNSKTDALPFLRAALSRYAEEFPSFEDGVTRTERQILRLVRSGVSNPAKIFSANMAFETALYFGDWPIFHILRDLSGGARSLLSCSPTGTFQFPPEALSERADFLAQSFSLTDLGAQVLDGRFDAAQVLDRDAWLGGVRLKTGTDMWTWDAGSQQFKLKRI